MSVCVCNYIHIYVIMYIYIYVRVVVYTHIHVYGDFLIVNKYLILCVTWECVNLGDDYIFM